MYDFLLFDCDGFGTLLGRRLLFRNETFLPEEKGAEIFPKRAFERANLVQSLRWTKENKDFSLGHKDFALRAAPESLLFVRR